ncbi:MAG: PEGA domain-containing protein [Myxococcota bacterium]|nr:PEGA domain-containing protein [Myxococcota bacterium]
MRISRLVPLMILFAVVLGSTARAQNCPAAKPGRYAVKIDSTPQGAAVYIGDKACGPVGNTPWTGKLNKGSVQVTLEIAGYAPETKTFKVGAVRKVQTLFVPLNRQPQIEINPASDPNLVGAQIFVDGVSQGVIQGAVVIKTTAGRHQLEIRKEGFETLTQWVDLTATPALTLTPTLKALKKATGAIVVDADVKDAEVYVNGNKHPDTTPTIVSNLAAGTYMLEVKKGPGAWKQSVTVEADKQVKVRAELAAQGFGIVRVLSDTPGSRVFIDGAEMGPAPVDIKDVKPGEHILQVKAPNFAPMEKRITVIAGGSPQVVKFDLAAEAAKDSGTLKVISTLPDAEVVIDGAVVGKAPQEKKLSAGKHPIMVRLSGYKSYEETVNITAGQTLTVTAELKGVGRLRILSSPSGAQVLVNGLPAKDKDGKDKTPIDIEVETGKTIVRLEYPGRVAFEETLDIKGGQTETISRELAVQGKSEEELEGEQKGLSSWGARALPRGRSTVDFDAGYPYYAGLRITVGAGRLTKQWGFDATVSARTMFSRNELGLGGRMMVANQNPFSAALFANFYFGSSLLDNSYRNGVTFETGVLASLTALTNVTISGRAYFQFWSDRHCPEVRGSVGSLTFTPDDAEATEECDAYRGFVNDPSAALPGTFTDKDRRKMELLTDEAGVDMFGRDNGARFLISVIAEIAIDQRWNVYGHLEGAPFQDERALFTNLFSGSMPDKDVNLYGRIGLTYKF